MSLRVLVACEFTGTVRQAFRIRGHDAWSCDFREAEDGSPFHLTGNCMDFLDMGWDLLIAHPPCTHLALAGNRWLNDHWVKLKDKPPRWHDGSGKRAALVDSVALFKALLNCSIPRRCIENPMSTASTHVAPKTQTIHPWQFGHPEQKTTWLWLRGLPNLKPTKIVYDEMMRLPKAQRERINWMSPGPDREKERSRTYQGIADALAEQYGASDCPRVEEYTPLELFA